MFVNQGENSMEKITQFNNGDTVMENDGMNPNDAYAAKWLSISIAFVVSVLMVCLTYKAVHGA